jgi:hypothetical protein
MLETLKVEPNHSTGREALTKNFISIDVNVKDPSIAASNQSWRSTGWTPLAYPAAALFQESPKSKLRIDSNKQNASPIVDTGVESLNLNPYFPLHKDVLLAAAREMLILDTSINPSSLEVNRKNNDLDSKNADDSVGVTASGTAIVPEDSVEILRQNDSTNKKTISDEKKRKKKRKQPESRADVSFADYLNGLIRHKRSKRRSNVENVGDDTQHIHMGQDENAMTEFSDTKKDPLLVQLSGEELAERLLRDFDSRVHSMDETLVEANRIENDSFRSVNDIDEGENDTEQQRVRKVSDVDDSSICGSTTSSPSSNFSISPHLAVACSTSFGVTHVKDRFLPASEEQLLLPHKNNLDQLLSVSILVETQLRQVALQMVHQFTRNLSANALREFMGYKSPSIKQERIVQLISDFLFDVSHAMFAWDKTDKDLFPGALTNALDIKRRSKVCEELFDSRALKKIGGFKPSSLLYHAVSIKYLRADRLSWASIAKKDYGKKMFRHHKSVTVKMQVGQLRRGHRVRKSRSVFLPLSEEVSVSGTRSRSSSIASCEESDIKESIGNSINLDSTLESTLVSQGTSPVNPGITKVTLTREKGKNWGILLAKEGTVCVVMRVPAGTKCLSDKGKYCLEKGDLLLSIRNEKNDIVTPPSGYEPSSSTWFTDAVDLFKRSTTLHLEIRRVSYIS